MVNPFLGTFFGTGIDKQCHMAIEKVRKEIDARNTIILNIDGHSRVGIATLMLANQLSNINPELLSIQ